MSAPVSIIESNPIFVMSGYAIESLSPEGEAAIREDKISPIPSSSTYIAFVPPAAHVPAPLTLSDRPVTIPALILAPEHDRYFIPYLRRARPGFHAALDNLTIQGYYSDEEEEDTGWNAQEDVGIRFHDIVEDEFRHEKAQHTKIQSLHPVGEILEEAVQTQEPRVIAGAVLHEPQEGVEQENHCAVEDSMSYEEDEPKEGTDGLHVKVSSTPPLPTRRLRSVRRQVITRGEASPEPEPVEGTEAFHRKYPNIPHRFLSSPPPATVQPQMERLRRMPSPPSPSPNQRDYSGSGRFTCCNTTVSMYRTLTALGAHPDAIPPIVKGEKTRRVQVGKEEDERKGVWGLMSDFWWKKPEENHKGKGRNK
jgi:hypothetical protein